VRAFQDGIETTPDGSRRGDTSRDAHLRRLKGDSVPGLGAFAGLPLTPAPWRTQAEIARQARLAFERPWVFSETLEGRVVQKADSVTALCSPEARSLRSAGPGQTRNSSWVFLV
jgi:hypothetical protein